MKGKKILKRIAVSILTLAVMCSNIPATAGSLPDDDLMIVTDAEPVSEDADDAPVSDPAENPTDPASSEDTDDTDDIDDTFQDDEEEEEAPSDPADDTSADDPGDGEQGLPPAEETPDADTSPVQPKEPDAPAEPEVPEEPENSEETKPDYQEDEPLDFENQIPITEVNTLPDADGTAASIWFAKAARSQLAVLYDLAGDEPDEKKAWTFDAYYVNQQNPYDVTKTGNFDLKYQMEFHASQDLAKGAVLIKIDAALYTDRYGNVVLPTEIAVPEGTIEKPVSSRTTPFNYYKVEEEDGTYLVFFNYKKIPSGTNAAWQVLYKNQKLMNIVDETPWTLTPQISVDTGAAVPDEENPDPAPARPYEKAGFEERTALTGRIDSSVTLKNVSKTAYNEPGRNYGPGLYTKTQVERYINGSVPDVYLKDGRLDTETWRFVVWDVKLQGTATQPWTLQVLDRPSVGETLTGMQVVGYKDNSSSSTSYRLAVNAPDAAGGGDSGFGETTFLERMTNESWGNRFYVVTAYPADRVSSGTVVRNEIDIRLIPWDEKDEWEEKTSTPATWAYADYDWDYSGEKIGVEKKNGIGSEEDDTRYTGWLDVYRRHSEKGEDYGEIPYSTTGVMHGYSDTHWTKNTDGHMTGEYIPGTYYTFTTADDFLYLYTDDGKDGQPMTGDDYYFSDVTVTQTDYGYDVWEDERQGSELGRIDPADLPADVFDAYGSEVRIYAMLANSDDEKKTDDKGWTLIHTGYMNASTGRFSVNLRETLGDEWWTQYQPYRIKVEHDSIDFESICQIDVNVCLKAISKDPETVSRQLMKAVLDARGASSRTEEKSPVIQLENLSGAMCQAYRTDEDGIKEAAFYSFGPEDVGENSKNYKEPGLIENTQKLYPGITEQNLPVRDSAVRELTWLNEIAEANKNSKTTNDVNNNRVLVDYYLTAYDGYEIYDRNCLEELKEEDQTLISPARTHVVFYDLLPYGMQYDASTAPTAGRITELDKNEYYKTRPGNWSKTQVQVVVDPSRDIIPDYRGTGRTMVAFHVIYTGADAASYTDQKWIEGWGVSFRAYYDWKDISQINHVDINSNLCAFMPDFSELAEGSNDSHPSLCGLNSEVYFDNGSGIIDEDPAYADMVQPEDGEAIGNIDGISVITDAEGNEVSIDEEYRTVLYAKNILSDNVATASASRIETLVHADADTLGAFGPIATVPVTENPSADSLMNLYTYDNTVTVDAEATNVVIFNRLEMAAVDRKDPGLKDPFFPFEENPWSGTFRGLDTSGLEKQGITGYKIYYSAESDAPITEGDQDPAGILTDANGWYTEEAFIAEFGSDVWQQQVKAVAVDLGENVIKANSSVSFRIKMTAPMPDEGHSVYTYNNASFSSMSVTDKTRSTVTGNSVRVTISRPETLEIIKKTSGTVPSAVEEERFEFRIYEEYQYDGETEQKNLAYTQYRLYRQNRDGVWEEQKTQAYATDGNGYLYLHADEKAVFELADTEHLVVRETESVFWESQVSRKRTKVVDGRRIGASDGDILSWTVTNTYRPVLYAQKSLSSVPAGTVLTEADQEFTFRIRIKGSDEEYHELSGAEYWVVDSVRLDGGIPAKLASGTTDSKGQFPIRAGQIIALFPGLSGTEYELSEIVPDGTEEAVWNWYCANSTLTGKLPSVGDSRTITNYYRWKDLLLKKEITHQTKEDYDASGQVFTFRLMEAALGADGEPLTDPEGNPVAKTKEDGTYTTAGLEWVLLEEEKEATAGTAGTEEETPGESAAAVSGVLGKDGTFSCAAGYRTIKIQGLEAGKLYVLEELTDGIRLDEETGKPLYVPNNDTLEVTMPIYSTKKDVTITNDYQMRPLIVTKTVVKNAAEEGEEEEDTEETGNTESYRFTVTIHRTMADGTTKEFRPEAGTGYLVTKQGAEDQTRVIGEDGTFVLSDGETAVFEEIGMLGDRFIVTEIDNMYQVYPANGEPFEGILSGDGGEASFVNGKAGSLILSKVYTGLDETGKELVENWMDYIDGKYDPEVSGPLPPCDVSYILNITVDGVPYEDMIIGTRVNMNGETEPYPFGPGMATGGLIPGITIILPVGGENGIPENAVYTLEETEESRHSIKRWDREDKTYWMQVNQSDASDALLTERSVTERPVAVIYNEVSTLPDFEGSQLGKWMTPASSEVPVGAELMWRVEKYDADSGVWSPAEGISYAVFAIDREVSDDDFNFVNSDPVKIVSTQVETTKSDGNIPLIKTDYGYPFVWFQNDQVYVNLYKEEDIKKLLQEGTELLRLVEVTDASDSEWGLLAGYVKELEQADQDTGGADLPATDLPLLPGISSLAGDWMSEGTNGSHGDTLMFVDADSMSIVNPDYAWNTEPESAMGFMNSNASDTLEIEKKMSEASDTRFTMILKQVLSVEYPVNNEDSILASAPASGIPYTVIKADGSRGSGVTGSNGEIGLFAGERAVLNVPEGTMWTVSEQTFSTPNYRLIDLAPDTGEGSPKLTKLNENLMLVNLPASVRYELIFDDNFGFGGPGTLAQIYKERPEKVTFTIPDTVPTLDGYRFVGWSPKRQYPFDTSDGPVLFGLDPAMYRPGDTFEMRDGWESETLYAVWKKEVSLTYIDELFPDRTNTEYYDIGTEVKIREALGEDSNYNFLGWATSPESQEVVYSPGASVRLTEDTALYAVQVPVTPKREELYKLLRNFAEVECIERSEEHKKVTYSTIGNYNDAAVDNNAYYSDGSYYCVVTLDGNVYAEYYGFAPVIGVGKKHRLAEDESRYKTIILKWNKETSKWESASQVPVTFKVVEQ